MACARARRATRRPRARLRRARHRRACSAGRCSARRERRRPEPTHEDLLGGERVHSWLARAQQRVPRVLEKGGPEVAGATLAPARAAPTASAAAATPPASAAGSYGPVARRRSARRALRLELSALVSRSMTNLEPIVQKPGT
jgi:hypothetical protein